MLVVRLVAALAFALAEKTHHASVLKRRMLDGPEVKHSYLPDPKDQGALGQSMHGKMGTGRTGI